MGKYRCFFCRGDITWLSTRSFQTYVDSITGEAFKICGKCIQPYVRATGGTGRCYSIYKECEIRVIERFCVEANVYPYQLIQNLRDDDVRLIARKYMNNYSGALVYNCSNYLIYDENSRKILFNHTVLCSFSDIIDYKVLDHSTEINYSSPENSRYSTQSKNALWRTLAGNIVAGPAGAVIGGLTSNHSMTVEKSATSSYQSTRHDFHVVVRLRKLGQPVVNLHVGLQEEEVMFITGFLDQVIQYDTKG